MLEKLKSYLAQDAIFNSILLVLVATASFGLGRQSVIEKSLEKAPEVKNSMMAQVPQPEATAPTPINPSAAISNPSVAVSGEVVASKSGTKYHLPTCSGAKTIKPENLIVFESIEAAKAAGYTAAANCPGIK